MQILPFSLQKRASSPIAQNSSRLPVELPETVIEMSPLRLFIILNSVHFIPFPVKVLYKKFNLTFAFNSLNVTHLRFQIFR